MSERLEDEILVI